MRQDKPTSFVPLLLILPIGLVAIICLVAFRESSAFLLFFVLLLISSATIASVLTSIQLDNSLKTDRLFNSFFKEKPLSRVSKSVLPKSDRNENNSGPAIEFRDYEKIYEETSLSLHQYLQVNDFKLMAEIIDTIEWKRFELLCHLILKGSGLHSCLTNNGADEGVDIRVFDNNDEKKTACLIQCKKWQRTRKVDRPLLQQLRGQMAAEKVENGGYCATSGFTIPAQEFATANNIELFNQDKIINSFNKLSGTVRESTLKELLNGDYWTPSCASCGEKFEKIQLKNGNIVWGCSNSNRHGWSSIPYYEAAPIKNVH